MRVSEGSIGDGMELAVFCNRKPNNRMSNSIVDRVYEFGLKYEKVFKRGIVSRIGEFRSLNLGIEARRESSSSG